MKPNEYFKAFQHFTTWILKEMGAIHNKHQQYYPLKIAAIEKSDTGKVFIAVDVTGIVKHVFPKYTPQELLTDDIIVQFPPLHVKAITALALTNCYQKLPEYEIISQAFLPEKKHTSFTIMDKNNLWQLSKSAEALLFDEHFFKKFSVDDQIKIAYIAGQENILQEA